MGMRLVRELCDLNAVGLRRVVRCWKGFFMCLCMCMRASERNSFPPTKLAKWSE